MAKVLTSPWLTTSRLGPIRNITTRLRKDKKTRGKSEYVIATKEWIKMKFLQWIRNYRFIVKAVIKCIFTALYLLFCLKMDDFLWDNDFSPNFRKVILLKEREYKTIKHLSIIKFLKSFTSDQMPPFDGKTILRHEASLSSPYRDTKVNVTH